MVTKKPFGYSEVKLNLPCLLNYNLSKPWYYLVNRNNEFSSVLAIYVDDQSIHAPSETEKAGDQQRMLLRLQDASRKRRPQLQQGGMWAGSIIHTNNKEVGLLIINEHWTKTRSI